MSVIDFDSRNEVMRQLEFPHRATGVDWVATWEELQQQLQAQREQQERFASKFRAGDR